MFVSTPLPGSDYGSWAKCAIGSYVIHESVSNHPHGMQALAITTATLTRLTPEKAVIKYSTRVTIKGSPIPMDPVEARNIVEIPAQQAHAGNDRGERTISTYGTEEEGYSVESIPLPLRSKDAHVKEGDEAITIAGLSLQCHWIERSTDVDGTRFVNKVWITDHIPGGIAKTVSEMGSQTSIMVATAYRKMSPGASA